MIYRVLSMQNMKMRRNTIGEISHQEEINPNTICFMIFLSCTASIALDSYAGKMWKALRHVSVDESLHLQLYVGLGLLDM